uniref:Uncharacterized protein n=1 Tax=viral metagenome TaxID=1070528 RepID=A0A6C0C9X0_9ZZZZ
MFIFLLFLVANSQICGYQKISTVTNCAGLARKDCVTSLYTGSTPPFQACVWSGSCSNPTSAGCEPSCFAGGRISDTTCTGLGSGVCNQKYAGTDICFWNGTCVSEECDNTCTGTYQKASTCTGLPKYKCESYYIDDGTSYKNCKYNGACVVGEGCSKICTGSISTTNCSSIPSALICPMYYELRSGVAYECGWSGSCKSKYPQECKVQSPITPCSGSTPFASCATLYTTAATCGTGKSWFDVPRFCVWNYGSGVCDNGPICST